MMLGFYIIVGLLTGLDDKVDAYRKGLPFQVQVATEPAPPLERRKQALDAIMGAYPLMTSSTEFTRLKQEEIELEERKLRP